MRYESIGFTGTRQGLNDIQKRELYNFLLTYYQLSNYPYGFFRHGDCVGADAEAHEIALSLGFLVIVHPPLDPKLRAYCTPFYSIEKEEEYLDRNKSIVHASNIMIACPHSVDEEVRSGTWSTVRYADKLGRTVFIVRPTGDVVRYEKQKDIQNST